MKKRVYLLLAMLTVAFVIACSVENEQYSEGLYSKKYWETELNAQGDCCNGPDDSICYPCGGRDDVD